VRCKLHENSPSLTWIDSAIIILYLLFISWQGFKNSTSHHTLSGYFLADRQLTWPLIGASIFATNISTSSIIGLASSGYENGVSVFDYEWAGSIMLVVFAVFIVPYYLKYQLTTVPEYLERRFDQRSRVFFSIISIVAIIFIDISGALYAGSLLFTGVFPQISTFVFIILLSIIAGLYTLIGGFRAVIATDTVQAILFTLSTAIVAGLVYWKIGSLHDIKTAVAPHFLSMIQPAADSNLPWPALIISLPILGFYFMCTNQYMVQRVLGAKTVNDGRKGAIFGAFLKLPMLFILVLPAVLARTIFPHLNDPNVIFPRLIYHFLPTGLLGIVLVGFIAALMSSVDSALAAISSIATLDIYKRFKPESSQSHLLRIGKLCIIAAVVIASVWAPFIGHFQTLWQYLQAVLSYLSPPVVACFLWGLFWDKASKEGAFYTLCFGSSLGILLVINNLIFSIIRPIHFLYSATIIFVFSSAVMVIVSLLYPDDKHFTPLQISFKEIAAPGNTDPWYLNYQFFAAVVCLFIAVIVIVFW
jgi:SSS family solute:Na+ symporter